MAEPQIIRRSFAGDLELRSDGRTVRGLAIPFGVEARVSDGGPSYLERFEQGSFTRTIKERGNRVKALVMHNRQALPIGRASVLTEAPDGLYCELVLSQTRDAEECLTLLRDGALDGLSVGFRPIRARKENGVVVREEVRLDEISVVSFPAYDEARVQAIRSADRHHLTIAHRRLAIARVRAGLIPDIESE